MLDVGLSKFPSEDHWASSQSSVVSGKQERSSSSSSTSSFKEQDYIGMNEVSSSFKVPSSASRNELNLQETELRLGICCNGASFQPKLPELPASAASESPDLEEKKPLEMANKSSRSETSFVQQQQQQQQQQDSRVVPKAGAKRGFSEAIGGEAASFAEARSGFSKLGNDNPFTQLSKHPLLPPLYPWKVPKQQFISPKSTKVEDGETKVEPGSDPVEPSTSRAPVVGWPPVQSFRKNTLAVPQPSKKLPESQKSVVPPSSSTPEPATSFVKVYMDGVSIGRKVEIKTDDSYDKLVAMLEDMFQYHIPGDNKKLSFLSDSEFVLTYEDKDGDLMLVGDVPWKMFVGTVKRLRIMKGTDAIGLAPRGSTD